MSISSPEPNEPNQRNRLLIPISDRDRIQKAANSSIVLVNYGDYQCPESGIAHQTIKTIQQQLNYPFSFVFRHFPQPDKHPQSFKAAEAAEAAAAQGQFWQMHNTLFEHQDALDDSYLVEYADVLKLNIFQFLRDMSGHVYAERINQDIENARYNGITNTPILFINNIRYHEALDVESLSAAILKFSNI